MYRPSDTTRPSRVVFTWLLRVPANVVTALLSPVLITPGAPLAKSRMLRVCNGRFT